MAFSTIQNEQRAGYGLNLSSSGDDEDFYRRSTNLYCEIVKTLFFFFFFFFLFLLLLFFFLFFFCFFFVFCFFFDFFCFACDGRK